MAQNTTGAYRKFRYYEGVCSSSDFIKELAKVVSLGVKTEPIKDAEGNVITEAKPIKVMNWDIVYPMVDTSFAKYESFNTRDKYLANISSELTDEEYIDKLENQIAQIKDRVVLKTTTTEKDITNEDIDDLSVSGESDMASTTMYVELYKPKYLANPEEYPLDAELQGLTPQLITKEMYREARKSTASVIYDLAQLVSSPLVDDGSGNMIPDPSGDYSNVKSSDNYGLITKKESYEYVDAVSTAYDKNYLYDSEEGILVGIAKVFGYGSISGVIDEVNENNKTASCTIPRAYLNAIKQTNDNLYNFLFDICGLKTAFTTSDYDLIEEMILKVTYISDAECYITLSFKKMVEIYYINLQDDGTGKYSARLNVVDEYGHESLEELRPELYSEGRYVPLPTKYLGNSDTTQVLFEGEQIKFCLDKITDESVLYGTIVLRYNYDKQLDYTDLSSLEITDSVTLENNHYCLIRMFDNPNSDFSGPEPNIYDNQGNITSTNSHTSPWSKLSWYQDFEEIMMDHIDEDVSVTSVTDGTLLVPLETPGLTADTRISYWINTNNDRFSLIVMGNPALDYERDRHLISSCYVGRIDSFENSINDVSGNFGLYTSSSTTPCKTSMEAYDTQYHINRDFDNMYFVDGAPAMAAQSQEWANKYPQATGLTGNIEAYIDYTRKIGGLVDYTNLQENKFDVYYITLTGNKFFNENEMARYMILDANNQPVMLNNDPENPLYYDTVAYRTYLYGASDSRANQVAYYINSLGINNEATRNYKVLFNFGYYEQKFVITSGITRDAFGNVVGIETIDDYGKNTSDGTLSVSMYHTRSKAFYQRHHFLFATTEEYMSKVMYGKSSYTGEYYADRIKITHGNDGPRGILCDTLVIDSSSLYPKDELVINKDFSKSKDDMEETFTYFPITAPFSPLSDGPNARYGLALKKAEREPEYTDNIKILNIATNELNVRMANIQVISGDQPLPQQTENGCGIYWTVLGNSIDSSGNEVINNWILDERGQNITITYPDNTTKNFTVKPYDANNIDVVVDGFVKGTAGSSNPGAISFVAEKGTSKTIDFKSNLTLKAGSINESGTFVAADFEPNTDIDNVFYGYSDTEITEVFENTVLTKIIDDGTEFTDNVHEYAFNEFYTDLLHRMQLNEIKDNATGKVTTFTHDYYNAHPDKYLNIFFTKKGTNVVGTQYVDGTNDVDVYNRIIMNFVSIPLHYENSLDSAEKYALGTAYYDLLQYPCSVTAYASGLTDKSRQGIFMNSIYYSQYEWPYQEYNTSLQIKTINMAGPAKLLQSHYAANTSPINIASNQVTIPADKVVDDLFVNIAK